MLFELCYGAAKSARPERNAQRIADFLSGPIEVLPFEDMDTDEAGDIRAALERAGTQIGPYDVLVAAHARRRDALVVTANEREFARVPRLKFEIGRCRNEQRVVPAGAMTEDFAEGQVSQRFNRRTCSP